MFINQKQLKKIIVETQSGQLLGRVSDFEIETDTSGIEKYFIKNKDLITGLFEDKLMIHKNQVISFNNEKMVVEDLVIKSKAENKVLPKMRTLESSEQIITSKES